MSEHIETTFVGLKPDTVKRGLVGEIVSIIEDAGFKIVGMKMVEADDEILEQHYEEHLEKDFYDRLAEYMKQGPIVALAVEGVEAVENLRKLVGETNPKDAHPATIRGKYSHTSFAHADGSGRLHKNLIHASATVEEAEEELDIWFEDEELFDYRVAHEDETR